MGEIGWKSELSLVQEFFGHDPMYPIATEVEHQSFEFHKQNELLKNLSYGEQEELRNTTFAICRTLDNGFGQLYEVNQKGFETITNAIESGTEELSSLLNESNRSLEQIEATMQWGFSSLLNQLTITNKKLDQIIHLLNIPESLKERKNHLEEGFDNMKKSRYYPRRYSNAKEHFESALKLKKDDYLSTQQLGLIHLYSDNFLDLNLSEEYLKQSILDSRTDIGFARNQQNSSSFHFTYNASKITATSLMHLARIYYIKEDYKRAFKTALEGLETYEMVGIYFDLSKYLCALNDSSKSILYLDKAISMDRYISVKVLTEKPLNTRKYVQEYLKELSTKTNQKVLEELHEIKKIAHQNTAYKSDILRIEAYAKENTYLDALKALETIGYTLYN